MEIAEQNGLARHLTLYIAGERLHIRLEELYIGMVGVKLDVKRVFSDIDAAVEGTGAAVRLGNVGLNEYALGVIIKFRLDVYIAHHSAIVGDILYQQARRVHTGCTRQQVAGIDAAGGSATKVHVVDGQRLEDIIQIHIVHLQA